MYKKVLFVKLVIKQNYTEMRGQHDIKETRSHFKTAVGQTSVRALFKPVCLETLMPVQEVRSAETVSETLEIVNRLVHCANAFWRSLNPCKFGTRVFCI